jgi:hypothetical protein
MVIVYLLKVFIIFLVFSKIIKATANKVGICNCLRQPWTHDQPIREFLVGLPANARAVMVFAGYLERLS